MNVLVTGAFGNLGTSTVHELIRQGHSVRCFDLQTKANERAARRLNAHVGLAWGDLRRREDVAEAVRGQDAVIHLAFIIPKLSSTGVECEAAPEWAREINVGGTRTLLDAMKAEPLPPKILFASSCAVYGRTQQLPPPRTVWDPVAPVDHYTRHKVECEELVRSSGLEWTILRLAAALPIAIKLDGSIFDIPLANRMEYVHTRDVGLAFANAVGSTDVWGRLLLVGGGPSCRHTYGEIAELVLAGLGVGMLPEEAFATAPYMTDWLDTAESQRLLRYQRHTLDDYVRDMQRQLGYRRHLVRAFRPLARRLLLRQSRHYRASRPGRLTPALQGMKAVRGVPTHIQDK